MKKFIFTILLFFLLLISAWNLVLKQWEYIAYNNNHLHPYKRVNYVTNLINENPDLVILGNSRAEGSYDVSILSNVLNIKCTNLGWAGYPFNYQYNVMWKTYLTNNNYPKYVLLEVGPWAFLDYVNPIYIIELLPYINRPEFQFYFEICPELSTLDHFAFYRYRGKTHEIIEQYKKMRNYEKASPNPSKGWNSQYIGRHHELEQDPHILSILDTFIDECRQNGITLIFVCAPIHVNDGSSYFEMDSFWELIENHISGKDIQVLNYQNMFGNDTTLFGNSMHLNKKGKYQYSLKLAHDLDSLGIISR